MKWQKQSIWISWEKHRRTENLCKSLQIPLHTFNSTKPRYIKHPLFLIRTLFLINRIKPSVLFVQNPSIILTCFVSILKKIFKYKLIVDAHNI